MTNLKYDHSLSPSKRDLNLNCQLDNLLMKKNWKLWSKSEMKFKLKRDISFFFLFGLLFSAAAAQGKSLRAVYTRDYVVYKVAVSFSWADEQMRESTYDLSLFHFSKACLLVSYIYTGAVWGIINSEKCHNTLLILVLWAFRLFCTTKEPREVYLWLFTENYTYVNTAREGGNEQGTHKHCVLGPYF
jgi:hypothetical protein